MSAYAPPTSSSGQISSGSTIFNATNFQSNLGTTALTQSVGDSRYLKQMGGSLSGALTVQSGLTVNGSTNVNSGLAITGNVSVSGGSLSLKYNTFLPTSSTTIPSAGQLGFQITATPQTTSTSGVGGSVQDASIALPYGTYMVYGQVSVSNQSTTTTGNIGTVSISINTTAAISTNSQSTLVSLSMSPSGVVTQNMTAIMTNYTSAPKTIYLMTQITPAASNPSGVNYSTNPALAIFTAVRIA